MENQEKEQIYITKKDMIAEETNESLVNELKNIKQLLKVLADNKKLIEKELLERLGSENTLLAGDFEVIKKTRKGSKRLDKKKLEVFCDIQDINLDKFYTIGKDSEFIDIKRVNFSIGGKKYDIK